MWGIDNRTPFAAERSWVRDRQGVHHWIVAVRATYVIDEHGPLRLADEQQPPLFAAEHLGEPGLSSLRCEADLVAQKLTTDVIANASAYAPRGQPVDNLPVSLRVGPVHKQLMVFGPRVFHRTLGGVVAANSAAFRVQPIGYELAQGGTTAARHDARNPIGLGLVPRVGERAPSIEWLQDGRGPAGLGALAGHWSPRRELAGTYDAAWEAGQKPLLPVDYDERFVQCAPLDQRTPAYLMGGEPVELVHLSPGGMLRFELPRVALRVQSAFGGRIDESRPALVTVLIEPDERRLVTVWQSSLRVRALDVDRLDITRVEVA